ncbi:MAG: response regulator transcription factor [Candidatus Limnocylindrales bacterium]
MSDVLRVLLVEDEPANRALVGAIIARAIPNDLGAVELQEAGTIAEARAFLLANAVDAILVDVRLPDGNGLELVSEIRDRGLAAHARVVVVSASVLPAERSSALATGADEFLAKPFSSAELVALLKRLAARKRPAAAS